MNEYLSRQLDQISALISGLGRSNPDVEKLEELDRSLEMLSHRLKAARLREAGDFSNTESQGWKQDAVFYFNRKFQVVRFVGPYEDIFGTRKTEKLPDVDLFFTPARFKEFVQRTSRLIETGESQSFNSEIFKNGMSLPVHLQLEKITVGKGTETISAGMVFSRPTPSELNDYRDVLIENLPGLDVYLFDTRFRHVLAGGREKAALGLTNADFTGKTLYEVFDEKTQQQLYPYYRKALDGEVSEGEIRLKNRHYYVNASPVMGIDMEVAGGTLILQDVTKEKEIEKKLVKARRLAEEADKGKSVFLASMSHEIRTPLNAIIGFTGLLNKTELSPKQKKFSHLIQQSSEHLLALVNDVLFIFKLEMSRVQPEKVPFNVYDLVKNVYESLLFRADENRLFFSYEISETIPEILVGDPFRIKQILMNLTVNAIKFTDEGRVSLRVSMEKSTARSVFLRFEVEDTGIGIAKENLHKIFDQFAQLHSGNEKRRKGTGLGLTIVRKLVDLLNGELNVESEAGKGSLFSVVIPFEKARVSDVVLEEQDYGATFDLLKGKRVLYADDDEHNILLGESILKDWEVDYEVVYDGPDALDLLLSKKFDIVLMDIQMPGMSGVDVLKQVRSGRENPNRDTKMLAVTANIMESDIHRYMKSGFDGYILKPFTEEGLYNKICNLLNLDFPEPSNNTITTFAQNERAEINYLDTTLLMKTSGGDLVFYNQMIDTFIAGARETLQSFRRSVKAKNWKEIGKKAHKTIPSCRYFGLKKLVSNLEQLEKLTLHDRNYEPVPELTHATMEEIGKVIQWAENVKTPVEDK